MSNILLSLGAFQTQMRKFEEQNKMISASDVLSMIEQLQEDLKTDIDNVVEKMLAEHILGLSINRAVEIVKRVVSNENNN